MLFQVRWRSSGHANNGATRPIPIFLGKLKVHGLFSRLKNELSRSILLPFILLVMSVIVFRDLRYMFRKRASENWPKTEATIESATTVLRRLGSERLICEPCGV